MTGIMERHRHLDMIAIAALLLIVSGCAAGKATMTMANTVDDLITALVAAPPMTAEKVQAALDSPLSVAPGDGPFRIYAGKFGPGSDGRAADVEYRMPVSAAATAGPLLILKLTGPCLNQAQAQNRYGPLKLTDVPRGKSLDEETSFARTYPWGTLSFGFPERNRDCAATVVYNLNRR
jgi:hypothetical protein